MLGTGTYGVGGGGSEDGTGGGGAGGTGTGRGGDGSYGSLGYRAPTYQPPTTYTPTPRVDPEPTYTPPTPTYEPPTTYTPPTPAPVVPQAVEPTPTPTPTPEPTPAPTYEPTPTPVTPDIAAAPTPAPSQMPAPMRPQTSTSQAPSTAPVARAASSTPPTTPILTWVFVVLASGLAFQMLALGLRPVRRLLTLRHLRKPFWSETVDQRISNYWHLVLVGLRDAGWRTTSGEPPRELAKRLDIESVERAASILERARHGVGIDATDLAEMGDASEQAYRASRSRAGAFARLLAWFRRPLV
jgi:hypothetical protein